MKQNKKAIYASYGIEFKSGKINAPVFGFINPLLIDGNAKLGKGVFTWSMLAGTTEYNRTIDGMAYSVKGTCVCDCVGCYAKTGFYNMPSVIDSNFKKTFLARFYPHFVKSAIMAQIEADGIKLVRIHASGDFFSMEYINVWRDIVSAFPCVLFWSYTKNAIAEKAFDDFSNCNIVKSFIVNYGYNFGKCAYIIRLYHALKEAGNSVYICRCGMDKAQHCNTCTGCAKHDYVLFIEHSTDYKAEEDEHYSELCELIEAQNIDIASELQAAE